MRVTHGIFTQTAHSYSEYSSDKRLRLCRMERLTEHMGLGTEAFPCAENIGMESDDNNNNSCGHDGSETESAFSGFSSDDEAINMKTQKLEECRMKIKCRKRVVRKRTKAPLKRKWETVEISEECPSKSFHPSDQKMSCRELQSAESYLVSHIDTDHSYSNLKKFLVLYQKKGENRSSYLYLQPHRPSAMLKEHSYALPLSQTDSVKEHSYALPMSQTLNFSCSCAVPTSRNKWPRVFDKAVDRGGSVVLREDGNDDDDDDDDVSTHALVSYNQAGSVTAFDKAGDRVESIVLCEDVDEDENDDITIHRLASYNQAGSTTMLDRAADRGESTGIVLCEDNEDEDSSTGHARVSYNQVGPMTVCDKAWDWGESIVLCEDDDDDGNTTICVLDLNDCVNTVAETPPDNSVLEGPSGTSPAQIFGLERVAVVNSTHSTPRKGVETSNTCIYNSPENAMEASDGREKESAYVPSDCAERVPPSVNLGESEDMYMSVISKPRELAPESISDVVSSDSEDEFTDYRKFSKAVEECTGDANFSKSGERCTNDSECRGDNLQEKQGNDVEKFFAAAAPSSQPTRSPTENGGENLPRSKTCGVGLAEYKNTGAVYKPQVTIENTQHEEHPSFSVYLSAYYPDIDLPAEGLDRSLIQRSAKSPGVRVVCASKNTDEVVIRAAWCSLVSQCPEGAHNSTLLSPGANTRNKMRRRGIRKEHSSCVVGEESNFLITITENKSTLESSKSCATSVPEYKLQNGQKQQYVNVNGEPITQSTQVVAGSSVANSASALVIPESSASTIARPIIVHSETKSSLASLMLVHKEVSVKDHVDAKDITVNLDVKKDMSTKLSSDVHVIRNAFNRMIPNATSYNTSGTMDVTNSKGTSCFQCFCKFNSAISKDREGYCCGVNNKSGCCGFAKAVKACAHGGFNYPTNRSAFFSLLGLMEKKEYDKEVYAQSLIFHKTRKVCANKVKDADVNKLQLDIIDAPLSNSNDFEGFYNEMFATQITSADPHLKSVNMKNTADSSKPIELSVEKAIVSCSKPLNLNIVNEEKAIGNCNKPLNLNVEKAAADCSKSLDLNVKNSEKAAADCCKSLDLNVEEAAADCSKQIKMNVENALAGCRKPWNMHGEETTADCSKPLNMHVEKAVADSSSSSNSKPLILDCLKVVADGSKSPKKSDCAKAVAEGNKPALALCERKSDRMSLRNSRKVLKKPSCPCCSDDTLNNNLLMGKSAICTRPRKETIHEEDAICEVCPRYSVDMSKLKPASKGQGRLYNPNHACPHSKAGRQRKEIKSKFPVPDTDIHIPSMILSREPEDECVIDTTNPRETESKGRDDVNSRSAEDTCTGDITQHREAGDKYKHIIRKCSVSICPVDGDCENGNNCSKSPWKNSPVKLWSNGSPVRDVMRERTPSTSPHKPQSVQSSPSPPHSVKRAAAEYTSSTIPPSLGSGREPTTPPKRVIQYSSKELEEIKAHLPCLSTKPVPCSDFDFVGFDDGANKNTTKRRSSLSPCQTKRYSKRTKVMNNLPSTLVAAEGNEKLLYSSPPPSPAAVQKPKTPPNPSFPSAPTDAKTEARLPYPTYSCSMSKMDHCKCLGSSHQSCLVSLTEDAKVCSKCVVISESNSLDHVLVSHKAPNCDKVLDKEIDTLPMEHTANPDKVHKMVCTEEKGTSHAMYQLCQQKENHVFSQRKPDSDCQGKPQVSSSSGNESSDDNNCRSPKLEGNGRRKHVCKICSHKCNSSGELMQHLRSHADDRPFKCSKCPRTFKYRNKLNKHLCHLCLSCGVGFSQKIHLQFHLRTHSGERPFMCKECGKTFARPDHLQVHINTHSESRPYKCKTCPLAFKCDSNLRKHVRIHLKDKPNQCEQCSASFLLAHSLRLHMRTHTGEKPVRCNLCNLNFRYESSLRRHSNLKHPKRKGDKAGIIKCDKD